jgi:cell division protein FtsQ
MSERREITRAETVRLRRRQQVQRRQAEPTALVTRPLPAITSRNNANYITPRSISRPSTHRRFQAVLSMPGFHVRMPALVLPRIEAGSRLVSGFLCLCLAASLYLVWTLPEFRVVAAQVSGNERIDGNEINAVLNPAGQPVFTFLPADLETRLRLNYPELASARVTLDLPNVMIVDVTERQPLILWQQNNGYTWIDAEGVAFRPRGAVDGLISVAALGAPPTGQPSSNDPLSPVPYISTDLVKAIRTLAPSLPEGTTMVYDPGYGLGWADARGWQIFFGSESKDMALKLQVYQSLVASLMQRGIFPAFISVQYANAPFYRMSR